MQHFITGLAHDIVHPSRIVLRVGHDLVDVPRQHRRHQARAPAPAEGADDERAPLPAGRTRQIGRDLRMRVAREYDVLFHRKIGRLSWVGEVHNLAGAGDRSRLCRVP